MGEAPSPYETPSRGKRRNMAQLTVNDLTLGYENGAILTGLSFTVEKGDYLAIVGENGSGKSTLMKRFWD